MAYPLTHRQFYEGLKTGRLLGLKCRSCGSYTVPPKICCAECGHTELEVQQLSGRGKLRTFTVIRVPPEGFPAPYTVALAELDEGPWLMGNVEGIPEAVMEDLIGRTVTVGHRIVPPLNYSGGEGVAVTFRLE